MPMRYTFKQVWDKIQDFLSGQDERDYSENDSLIATIEQAIQKKTAVHVILAETSFTGDIVKYDTSRQQIVVKNFTKNVTRIIRIADIKRLRFVPSTVQTAQKNRFKKEWDVFHPTLFLNEFVQNVGGLRCGHRNHFSPNHVASGKKCNVLRWWYILPPTNDFQPLIESC